MRNADGPSTEPDSGFHPVSIAHLVMGVVFVGIIAVWSLAEGEVVDGSDMRWLLPVPWVAAGLIGLVAAAVTGGRHSTRVTGWVPPPEPISEPASDDRVG